ncbi:sensor domain-containing diguanylate cyclase [Paucibacter sp. XJ19-41]|uniref:sensor domain-containing diguanylate cyclase n=1 Tax=Paucibacter sp. XJ19-41 TaxID=2927824 RepID=UPI00234AEC37|nr:GGDEF domain-containing protein [Paucibacter sp. XJ19-41]MDC6168641.1 GGDEF domain-containing protein [Paucibacter sp. XJ19-41]
MGSRWRGLPWLVLAAGLGLSLLVWQQQCRHEERQLRAAFDASLRDVGQRVEQRMAAHEHLLQGLRGFVEAYPQTDAAALRRYVDALPLGADYAGLQGLGLALLVDAAELPELLRRQRLAGNESFRIWPEGQRPRHAPVVQIEPGVARNQLMLGRDLLAEPLLAEVLEAARDSGRLALSTKLALPGPQTGNPAGFLMALPIYRGNEPPTSVTQRRERLRGWVVAPVLVQELMASLYGELPPGLLLTLYDGQELAADRLLYRSVLAAEDEPVRPLLQAQEFLVVGGHTWTVSLQAQPRFASLRGALGTEAVLLAGAGLSGLLSLLAWLLATSRGRALALAERMTRALRESEQRWAFALEGAGDGVWDLHTADGSISSSARWKTIMGLRPGQGEPNLSQLLACTHPEDLPRLQSELQRCLDGQCPSLVSEYRVASGSGGWNWVLARATVVERGEQGRPLRIIGTLSDINARRQSEERLRFMALHDPLTELANRAHFDERMHFALANSRRYNENLGLILLDLDRFKPINDQFGHAVGDQLLQTVARRIKSSVRETDTVGRIGGDEFVVLLTGPVTRETAQLVADKIFNQVALPMELNGLHIEITCSLGLALYPEDGQDELSLTKAADDSMYRNKRAGRRLMGGEARAPGEFKAP